MRREGARPNKGGAKSLPGGNSKGGGKVFPFKQETVLVFNKK